jgi:hypothetical protein
MTVKYSYVAILATTLAVGGGVGALIMYGVQERGHRFQTESQGTNQNYIKEFQDALEKQAPARDVDELMKRMDAQWKLEEVIVKRHEAEYSSLTPFTSLASSGVTLLIAILGVVSGWFGRKHIAAATDKPPV